MNEQIAQEATDLWGPEPGSVTVEAMDGLVKDYSDKRLEYEAAKRVSGDKYAVYQEAEAKLITTLRAAGKKSYKVDNVGNITIKIKSSVKTPKTIEDKLKLFNWIEETYGKDVRDDMVSINSQKLNGFYNQEAEKHQDDALFSIPGLEAPSTSEGVTFTRAK